MHKYTLSAYTALVRALSEYTYRRYRAEIIAQCGLSRGAGKELDHIFPIAEGHRLGIPIAEMACRLNLQVLPSAENRAKGDRIDAPDFAAALAAHYGRSIPEIEAELDRILAEPLDAEGLIEAGIKFGQAKVFWRRARK